MLSLNISRYENTVDPDQLASRIFFFKSTDNKTACKITQHAEIKYD